QLQHSPQALELEASDPYKLSVSLVESFSAFLATTHTKNIKERPELALVGNDLAIIAHRSDAAIDPKDVSALAAASRQFQMAASAVTDRYVEFAGNLHDVTQALPVTLLDYIRGAPILPEIERVPLSQHTRRRALTIKTFPGLSRYER
ncbi:MAG: hypothetical protein M3N08_09090, partial [Pseudomonadota bacterium]|nr:hypothetical protein [Pseudomonadota bacterium]